MFVLSETSGRHGSPSFYISKQIELEQYLDVDLDAQLQHSVSARAVFTCPMGSGDGSSSMRIDFSTVKPNQFAFFIENRIANTSPAQPARLLDW